MPTHSDLSVAIDVTPLLGARTGIGTFVSHACTALQDSVRLRPYVVSRRARLDGPWRAEFRDGVARIGSPARLAVRVWGRHRGPSLAGALPATDVLHGTNFIAPPVRDRAVVVTVHDCAFVHFPDQVSADARRYAPVVRRLVAEGAWIHTPTEAVARDVRDTFGTERVRAVPHGVPALDPDATAADVPVGGPYLLTLGTLDPRKRPERAVHAFARLAADHPELRLVLAGAPGQATTTVHEAIDHLPAPVRERVVVLGHVGAHARAVLLRDAVALVQVSDYEGFGLPVLEALALGTPVVTTPAGGSAPEVAGPAAIVVEPDADALASAVDSVLTDSALDARLRTAGMARASEFTWERTAAGLTSLYREAAGG